MLTTEQVKTLKKLYYKEHLSQREIGRRLGIDRRSVARWLERDTKDRTPHRASPVNKSPGKLFLPYVKEQIALRGSKRGLTATLFRELEQQDPPFLGYEPISERTLERVVKLALAQIEQEKKQAQRARRAAARQAKAQAQSQTQAPAQVQDQAQSPTQTQSQTVAQDQGTAQNLGQTLDQAQAPAQNQAQVPAQDQGQAQDPTQAQSSLDPSAESALSSTPRRAVLQARRSQPRRHVCHQRLSLKPTSAH